jgi:GNAT superfamily N-acetyltransferase
VIHYRTFRNPDPPRLVEVWNGSFTGRGAVSLRLATLMEYFTFAKPYFDPEGLVVALAGEQVAGFAHAAFSPSATGADVDHGVGVLCALGVLPEHRRQGVGSELLRRSEDYLRRRGAREFLAGPLAPRNPFTFGLYGGCDSPGFLDSDTLARPFLEKRGYRVAESCLVFHRELDRFPMPPDPRFPAYRQRFEIHAGPTPRLSWWRECVLGPVELVEYRLRDKASGATAARATLWEMDTFSQQWNEHAVGVMDLEVAPEMRRQGVGKFLLAQILRHLHEQFFSLVEVQALDTNTPAVNLIGGLGFTQADVGRCFRLNDLPR